MEVRWAMVTGDGRYVTGKGASRAHLTNLFKDSVAGAFQIGPVQLFVAGPTDILWTVQMTLGADAQERSWGLLPRQGSRLWVLPSGHLGMGESIEAVEGTIALIQSMGEG